MQVILTEDIETLGERGDVVQVKDGHARNFLFPQKMALQATPGALKDLQHRIARIKAQAEKKHQEDQAKADKVTDLGLLELTANAGEGGKLFGAITTKELSKILAEKTGIEVERKVLTLDHPINRVGEYTLSIKFSTKVTAKIGIRVSPVEELS